MSTPAPPTIEQRIEGIEQKLAPIVAANTPRISTKVAGLLTAIVAGLTYATTSGFLTPAESAAVTVVITGIAAYLAAEET